MTCIFGQKKTHFKLFLSFHNFQNKNHFYVRVKKLFKLSHMIRRLYCADECECYGDLSVPMRVIDFFKKIPLWFAVNQQIFYEKLVF